MKRLLADVLELLDFDESDPADAADIEVIREVVQRRAAVFAQRLRDVEHPSVTGPRIRPVGGEPDPSRVLRLPR